MSNPDKESINKKIETLNKSVEWFYSDEFSLEKSLENYKKAISLAKEIESDLENLKNEIKILGHDFSKE